MWFVYILKCRGGSLYTGITNNLDKRLEDHKNGQGGKYTKSHKVLKLVYSEKAPDKSAAMKREYEIKSWPKSAKITLINSQGSSAVEQSFDFAKQNNFSPT